MIHSYRYCIEKVGEVGRVEQVKEFLVKVSGLPGAVVGEGVTFETGEHGRIQSLDEDLCEVLVLSRLPVAPKTKLARTGTLLSVSCGSGVLGHTLNTLGYSLTQRRFQSSHPEKRLIEMTPVGIWARKKVTAFFETGTAVVDLVVPLGKGQRELVIGDRKTGKTHFLLTTILSQVDQGTVCVWASLGKRKTEIKAIEEFLSHERVLDKCVIIAADSSASPGEIYLAPYTAMTIAEYFRDQGRNVLLILDDLTTHAKFYREIALVSGTFPGRESYPGDIFHIHSKLLERAGCFRVGKKEVTITCLPVAESSGGDLAGFIQTNLMSMTDGHLYFDSGLFFEGRRPAINIFLSVTRVGRQTQLALFRNIGPSILLHLKKYEEAQRFLRFGPEISAELTKIINVGDRLKSFFNQVGYFTVPVNLSAVLVALIWQELWDGQKADEVVKVYLADANLRQLVGKMVRKCQTLEELIKTVAKNKGKLDAIL